MKSVNESRFAFFSSLFFFFFEPDSLCLFHPCIRRTYFFYFDAVVRIFTLFCLIVCRLHLFRTAYSLLSFYFDTSNTDFTHVALLPSEPEDSEPLPSKIVAIGASCRWFGCDSNNRLDMAPSIRAAFLLVKCCIGPA